MSTDQLAEAEEHLDREDDSSEAIGRALWLSLYALVGVGVLAACVFVWLSDKEVVEEHVAAPVELPSQRAAPSVAGPSLPFVDVAAVAGVDYVHDNQATGQKLLPETMGGGCALVDYDSDGDQDLVFVDSNRWQWQEEEGAPSLRLYENDGSGGFTEVTESAGITLRCYGMGIACGDYDNDGDPDLFVTSINENTLLRNDGGSFTDVTAEAGVAGAAGAWSSSAAWFDADSDGDLDLIVGNYVQWSRELDLEQDFTLAGVGRAYGPPFSFAGSFPYLYRNEGDGTFTDVSEESGVRVANAVTGVPLAKSLGVRAVDIDRDGDLDVILANDTVQNLLLLNDGYGVFLEAGAESGLAFDASGKARGAMGIDAAHFRGDQTLGVAIGNFSGEMTALYVAQGGGAVFTDDAIPTGLGPRTRLDLSFGLFFFDADLDGRLDLFCANGHIEGEINRFQASQQYKQPSRLFWNAGDASPEEFLPVENDSDLGKPVVGRGAAYGDLDGDGDLDAVVTQIAGPPLLLRNDQATGNHWVRLKLVGDTSNRDAIGATVTATVGGRTIVRDVAPTRSYLSQVELPVTLGLGAEESVERVVVTWPDGTTQEVADLEIDRLTVVRQEAAAAPAE